MEVVNTLGSIGPKANEALPVLQELLKHEDKQIAASATKAIESISNQ